MTVFDFLKNRLRQAREWLLDYAYWVTLGAMIAVIVGTALYTDAVRPVSGGLLRGFSAQPVLWPSLDCWQAHPAVDLGAASGETAVCMCDGVVLSCVRDDLWGWHVAVRQTDGAVCTYSGLSCALVQAGQSVVRGQPLGDVMAAVPAESELGAHLHLSLYRDGEAAEPALPD